MPVFGVNLAALRWRFLGLEFYGEVIGFFPERVALRLVLRHVLVDGFVAPVVGHLEYPVLFVRIVKLDALFVGEVSAERLEVEWRWELFVERAALVVGPAIHAEPLGEEQPLLWIGNNVVFPTLKRCCWWW